MDIYLAKDWGAHMLRCRWKEILAKAVIFSKFSEQIQEQKQKYGGANYGRTKYILTAELRWSTSSDLHAQRIKNAK